MKVFIQRKPRGINAPWTTVERINKGNVSVKIARRITDKYRKACPDYVFRVTHNHPLMPPTRTR